MPVSTGPLLQQQGETDRYAGAAELSISRYGRRSPPRSALRPDANIFPVRNCAILLARRDHRRGSGFQYDPAAFSRHATPAKGSAFRAQPDRKSVVSGKSVAVRVDLGGRRIIKKKKWNEKVS